MADDLNTLFDLEIPIKTTGLNATREDFRALEQQGTESAQRVEQAMGNLAPPQRVAQGFRQATVSAQQTSASVQGLGRAATETAAANQSLALQQQKVAEGLKGIARDILQAKAAFDAGTISTDDLAAALNTARQQAVELKGGLALPTQQAEAFRAIMSATVPALVAADGAMQIIAEDVKLASAAFKAGTISADDYRVALQVAREQAIALTQGTQLGGSELTAFGRILKQTEVRTGAARQGLGTMRSSMLSLAATMVGTRSTLGTLAGAMLQFSIGNPLAVGVSAGLLGLVVLYEKLTDKTREAKEATDKLIESLRKERDERIAAEHPELPFQATTAQIRARQDELRRQLASEERGRAVALPGGDVRVERDVAAIERLRAEITDLDTLQLEALLRENEAQRQLTDSRRADLIALVSAGTATKAEEAALRTEYQATRDELAGMSTATRATVEGRARAADLTERLASIEAAFQTQAKATGKAVTDANKTVEARTQALIALQQLEGPTVDRWQALTDRATTLRTELAAGNLTLDQRVAKLKELRDIEASTGFGDVDQFEKIKTRGPDIKRTPGPLMTVQPTPPTIPGGEGSLFGGLVKQVTEDGTSVTDAITEVEGNIAAAAQEIGGTFADALTSGIKSAASGGGIGNAIKGLIGSMMAAIGEMAIKFGLAAIGIATLIKKIMDALAKLNPVVAIAAGVALVALGTALMSQNAEQSFGGRSSGPAPVNRTITVGSTPANPPAPGTAGTATGPATGMAELSLGASVAGASGATGLRTAVDSNVQVAGPATSIPMLTSQPRAGLTASLPSSVAMTTATSNVRTLQPVQFVQNTFNIVGPNDPAAQRQLARMVTLANQRGAA